MAELWLLKGTYDAPGWKDLERDSKEEKINIVIFDRLAWALVEEDEAPTRYDGLAPERPATGVYVDPTGIPIYIIDGKEVGNGAEVVRSLGSEAIEMLDTIGDADTVLDRLGRAY